MIRRQSLPPAQQAKLIEANMRDWDDPLPQPMSSLLEGLLSYVIRVMERAVANRLDEPMYPLRDQ